LNFCDIIETYNITRKQLIQSCIDIFKYFNQALQRNVLSSDILD